MTQAMPPAQPVSFDSMHAPTAPKNSEPQEDFSDTLRGQIESKSQDQSADSASAASENTVHEPPVESEDVVANTTTVAHRPIDESEAALPIAAPSSATQNKLASEAGADHAQQVRLGEMANSRQVMTRLADTQSARSGHSMVVTSKPAQGVAGAASGAAAPIGIAAGGVRQGIDLVAAKNQPLADAALNNGGLSKELPLQGFSRVVEAVSSTQVTTTTAPPVLAASAVGSQGALAPTAATPLALAVDTPLTNPGWGSAMAARLVWGASQGMQSASIELNPRDLGPVSVKLRMTGDEASITFVSQHALVREAVEAALPRLRELFAGDGINLGEVDISNGEGRPGSDGDAASTHDMPSQAQADASADPQITVSLHENDPHLIDSLVDTFA